MTEFSFLGKAFLYTLGGLEIVKKNKNNFEHIYTDM